MSNLIYDRTLADVEAGTAKGFYNISDLNRVNEKVAELAELLNQLGYKTIVDPKTWLITDIPTVAETQKYLIDIQTIKNSIATYATTPPLDFTTMENFTHEKANDLEKALFDIEDLLVKLQQCYIYSGEVFAGEL